MAANYKILGYTKSSTTTGGNLFSHLYYANPVGGTTVQTVVSTITVCNTSNSPQNYVIAIYPSSSAVTPDSTAYTTVNPENYIVKDAIINGNETISLTLGITLDTFDRIAVNASGATSGNYVSFFAFGLENIQ